jgi:hypothetical protein
MAHPLRARSLFSLLSSLFSVSIFYFQVSISGGAAADFVAHFAGQHERDHFLVRPPGL